MKGKTLNKTPLDPVRKVFLLRLPESKKRYQSWPTYWKTDFSLSSRKENLFPQNFALRTKQGLETALRCFRVLSQIREKLNTPTYNEQLSQLKLNPLIPIHFFVIWLCKSQSARKSILPKTLTSWAQREKTLQENVTFTEIKKIASWNYSNPGGTLEKLNKLKPSISRNEELYISKEAKTEKCPGIRGQIIPT